MVGMGSDASGYFPQKVARDNCIGVGAADTGWRCGGDAARAHMTDPAAQSPGAECALVFLEIHAKETQINAVVLGFFDRFNGGLIASPVPGIFYIFIYQVI
jgi:hypothetical protein